MVSLSNLTQRISLAMAQLCRRFFATGLFMVIGQVWFKYSYIPLWQWSRTCLRTCGSQTHFSMKSPSILTWINHWEPVFQRFLFNFLTDSWSIFTLVSNSKSVLVCILEWNLSQVFSVLNMFAILFTFARQRLTSLCETFLWPTPSVAWSRKRCCNEKLVYPISTSAM